MPIRTNKWIVVFSAALLFFYSFMQLNIMNPLSQYLMRDFAINAAQLGNLSSMYFYVNSLLVLPAGLLLDRFSPRRLILLAMVVSIVGVFGFAYAPDAYIAGFCRALMGFGGAFCLVGPMSIAAKWFEAKQLGFIVGCLITMCMIGGFMAQTPMTMAIHAYGWRHALVLDGFLGVFCMIVIWLFVIDRPVHAVKQNAHDKPIPFWRALRVVIFNPYNWLAGLYTAFMNLPIFLLGALWGMLYLTQAAHLSAQNASYVTAMLFVGSIIGAPLTGFLSDKLKTRRAIMMVNAMIACVTMSVIIYWPDLSFAALLLLFLLLGLITSSQSLGYPFVTEINPVEVTATANSIVSTTLIAGGFIFQPMFGWLMSLHDKPVFIRQVVYYSKADFRYGMLIMPIAFLASMLIAFKLKKRG